MNAQMSRWVLGQANPNNLSQMAVTSTTLDACDSVCLSPSLKSSKPLKPQASKSLKSPRLSHCLSPSLKSLKPLNPPQVLKPLKPLKPSSLSKPLKPLKSSTLSCLKSPSLSINSAGTFVRSKPPSAKLGGAQSGPITMGVREGAPSQ